MSSDLTGGPGVAVGDDAGSAAAGVASAARLAAQLAGAAGVRVQSLTTPAEQHAAAAVLQRVWGHAAGVPLPPEMLRAFAFTGNYVGAAFDGEQIVGVACAFRTKNGSLHSHIAGVLPSHQGHSIGYLLKLHQRAWALANGIASIGWTFDPLIRRNAYFNLVKLGADAVRYLDDFYGAMTDRINAGDVSDRVLVEWDLSRPVPGAYLPTGAEAVTVLRPGSDGEPVLRAGSDGVRLIQVPDDIDAVRQVDPALATRWRSALRRAMTEAFDSGLKIVGVNQDKAYVARRKDPG
ncbi:MAG: GNAT family N-acetyltransferase [Actinomycetota bacterium]|nr:GNAT family N-acetyltransferase [Actinomycetota bacterium]